ncbi:hypothetical protein QWI18_11725 [Pseudomonas sp. W2Oct36]|jgi:hypothetical protein|uniref:hypothetical protein n=1 Tax=unclassified Pseudomonas TaxID=196821 RepID=UPI00177E2EB4|nr:hypothetical protein [Pseudomonas sp. CFBP 8772]MBD8598078.1 hypothetical protein [Pseudomonas sp. CFBP 8772]
MITSAEEFVALRNSSIISEYDRAATEEAPISVWRDVIKKYPNSRRWDSHNKSVPLEILEELCQFDSTVRQFIAAKRKLSPALFEILSWDESYVVRIAVAANKEAPITILERLLNDQNKHVARAAEYKLKETKNKNKNRSRE